MSVVLRMKNAIVYGAGGAIGSAVARAYARAGAHVFLAGRTLSTLDAVANEIAAAGGAASTAVVDAMDPTSVDAHAAAVSRAVGHIDVSFNAISIDAVQNVPLVEIALDEFMLPIVQACRTHFITSTAAARRMRAQGSGVIVMLSSSAALETRHQMGGFNLACASIEALVRSLAGELGRSGVRVVGLRPNFTPETVPNLTDADVPKLVTATLLGRLPRLTEIAETAVYLASDAAGAMTGVTVNLTCGAIID
jgi:NAD(P)-dependent dehydrogenase (short-subunit alcohol dehydrogenase family)